MGRYVGVILGGISLLVVLALGVFVFYIAAQPEAKCVREVCDTVLVPIVTGKVIEMQARTYCRCVGVLDAGLDAAPVMP